MGYRVVIAREDDSIRELRSIRPSSNCEDEVDEG